MKITTAFEIFANAFSLSFFLHGAEEDKRYFFSIHINKEKTSQLLFTSQHLKSKDKAVAFLKELLLAIVQMGEIISSKTKERARSTIIDMNIDELTPEIVDRIISVIKDRHYVDTSEKE